MDDSISVFFGNSSKTSAAHIHWALAHNVRIAEDQATLLIGKGTQDIQRQ